MIHYQLRCDQDHQFDGWFKDSAGFDAQSASGLVACPHCGATEVHRALMTPSVAKGRQDVAPVVDQAGVAVAEPKPPAVSGPMPDHIRAMLQRVRAEVEKHCDHVGAEFADEARRIHRGESASRGIYGDATPEQAEALAEEGIEVARIPWVPRADG